MDVFTRKVLAHCLKPSIRQYDVVLLLEGIVSENSVKTEQVIPDKLYTYQRSA
jgi:hypothetical protein